MKNNILQELENNNLKVYDGDFLPDELDVNKVFILADFDRFTDWLPEEEGEEYLIELPIIEVGESERSVIYNQTGEYVVIELECSGLFGKYTEEIDVRVKDIWCY